MAFTSLHDVVASRNARRHKIEPGEFGAGTLRVGPCNLRFCSYMWKHQSPTTGGVCFAAIELDLKAKLIKVSFSSYLAPGSISIHNGAFKPAKLLRALLSGRYGDIMLYPHSSVTNERITEIDADISSRTDIYWVGSYEHLQNETGINTWDLEKVGQQKRS